MKKRMKAFIIRYELWWYAATGLGFIVAITALLFAVPKVSTTTLAAIQLFTGFTATVAAAASSIKSSDTTT